MISTPTRGIGRSRRVLMLLAGLVVAMAGTLAFAGGQAKAGLSDSFSMDFTNGQVNLGFAFKGAEILPAPQQVTLGSNTVNLPNLWDAKDTQSFPGEGTPPNSLTSFKPVGCLTQYTYRVVSPSPLVVAPNDGQGGRPTTLNPDYPCGPNPANATISGQSTPDGLVAQADQVRFPIMIVPNPLDGSPVPITLVATGPVTGTYVGQDLNIEGPLAVQVLTGLASNPLGTYCELPLPNRDGGGPLELTSGYSLPTSVGFNGTPFQSISGPGAVTGTWNVTEDSISVGGADCGTVNSVSKGLGGIWLGADVADPAPYPTCQDEGKVGTFPDCQNPAPQIGKVTISGPSKVKKGKSATWKVAVPSTGNTALTGVRLNLSGKGISVSTPMGDIAPGTTRTESVKAKPKQTGKITITAKVTTSNAGSKTVKKTITVVK